MKKFLTVILVIILTTACVFAGCSNKDVFDGNYIEVSEEKFKEYAEKIQESETSVDYEKGYRLAMNGNWKKNLNETETSDVYNVEYFIKSVDGELLMQGNEFKQHNKEEQRQKLFYKDKTLYSDWYGRGYNDNNYGKKEMEEDKLVKELGVLSFIGIDDLLVNWGEGKYYICESKEEVMLKTEQSSTTEDNTTTAILKGVWDNNGQIIAASVSVSYFSEKESLSLDITIVPWNGKFDFPSALEKAVDYDNFDFFSRSPFF